ncbi:nicotinamide riboside transporter PnuC [Ornithinimicrobium sp. F0845]|uniref:nicotinamide riboside transporter PnuC n=1 Tax=Ornithinimicrobium sp. F0845 TaxID=2926412 RepID=UPI001FF4FEA5|nr:nicotinamide riboside transporter PnuC [Ornithinimicrobium sp. F0845]MCK0112485.1 nicotinamide riboside transporter PnuC [Ornithinimicrobium sp. F0845]
MHWTEIAGFVTGGLCVWLVVRQNVWTFPIGIANNIFFIVLFTQVGLYAEAGLQVVYIGLGLLGWWWWLHGGPDRTRLVVRDTPSWAWPAAIIAIGLGTWALHWLLTTHTDSTVAGWDAVTTTMSLVAQLMLSRKWIGNWVVWIVADVIYIGLYASKGLWLTSVLYAVFLTLCVVGLRQWREARALQESVPEREVVRS